jgi:ferric-dicitrate binding protein FerR (iron transport regulator)
MENKINHIIARILSGEASLQDTLLLSDWLNEDEENRRTFSQIKVYWDAEIAYNNRPNPELLLKKIREKINGRHHNMSSRKKSVWYISIPAAAVIIAVLTIAYFVYYTWKKQEPLLHETKEYYTYLTNDNKTFFTLDDGTKVTLNKNSRFTYTNQYGIENRFVKLDGEAFFEVTKNPDTPFEVAFEIETGDNASIKVLGTVFGVKLDADEKKIIATLVTGSICFETQDQKITMTPNQQVEFNYSNSRIDLRIVDAEAEIAWKDGVMKYKAIVFSDLIKRLEKVYGVSVVIQDRKLASPSIMVTGAFDEKQSLEDVLKVISRSLPIKWSRKNGIYYIN